MTKTPQITNKYKFIYGSTVGLIAVLFIASTFLFRSDPRLENRATFAQIKTIFYTVAFAADRAFQSANVSRGLRPSETLSDNDSTSIPILVYHGVIKKPDGSTINLTEEEFKDQIFALKKAGYHSISLEDLYAFETQGIKLPDHPILITFDDGRADSFYNGDPILAAVGYKATIFVITSYAEGATTDGYYLTPSELKILQSTGRWSIGSHSANGHEKYPIDAEGSLGYFFSDNLWLSDKKRLETNAEFETRIAGDLMASKTYLEDLLGTEVIGFAFPFGEMGQSNNIDSNMRSQTVITVADSLFKLIFYQFRSGEHFSEFIAPDHPTKENLAMIHRIDTSNSESGDDLLKMLKNGQQKSLPYTDTFDDDNGWVSVWGPHTIENGQLNITPPQDQSGGAIILDGSQSWTNYQATAEVTSPNQTGIFLWTRFKNDNTNAGCNFGTNFVHIEETINGNKKVLKGVELPHVIPKGLFSITARVDGRTLICSINGVQLVSTEFLDPSLTQGGVGIKIWDETLGKSAVNITQFSATPIKSSK